VAQRLVNAGYDDGRPRRAGRAMPGRHHRVRERPAGSLSRLAERVRGAQRHGVSVAQDRIAEKRFFVDCAGKSGVLPAPHKVIATQADIDAIGDDCCPAS
jgi:5-(carboxyamino)imidazole ribonucleotide synthase